MSKQALIVKMGAIGDVITTVPAVRALHEQGFEIHWVCGSAARPLLQCYSWIKIIPVDDRAIVKGTPMQRLKSMVGFWRQVAWKKWDLVAILYYDWRYRLLALPVRARRRVALSNRSRTTALVTVRSYSDEFARIILGQEDSCRPQGMSPLRPDCLPRSPLSKTEAPRRIAIVPGGTANLISQQTLRRWPIENYVQVASHLKNRGWELVLIGGPEDEWVRSHFAGIEIIDCIARFSIPEVISMFDTCDAVISHDTGPMHMAGLSNACVVALFGPTNPGHVLPRRPGIIGIWGGKEFACRPCYDLRTYAPCNLAGCMREISPTQVIQQLDRLLADRSRNNAESWQVIFANPESH